MTSRAPFLAVLSMSLLVTACSGGGARVGATDSAGGGDGDAAEDAADSDVADPTPPRKLDVVLVVDDSSSMCAAQNALSESVAGFARRLAELGVDARVGVTTTDMGCDPAPGVRAKGSFAGAAPLRFPPSCQERLRVACYDDADCAAAAGGEGAWRCLGPATDPCVVLPSGWVASTCRRQCETDAECVDRLGDPTAICQKLSENALDWGCIVPPRSAGCDGIGAGPTPWAEGPALDGLRCLALVGVDQESCNRFEQGLGAAWAAVAPDGPNPAQAAAFRRRDADLAIVIVSNDDDCSLAPGGEVGEADQARCALLADADAGGPLVAPAEVARRFQDLAAAEGRVAYAVVASGDSLAADPAARDAERAAFLADRGDEDHFCFNVAYICDGLAPSLWGRRYQAFVAAFGPRGGFVNLCRASATADALDQLVNLVALDQPTTARRNR